MPGMENFAPERTLTSSGFAVSPSFWPMCFCSFLRACSISLWMSAGTWFLFSK